MSDQHAPPPSRENEGGAGIDEAGNQVKAQPTNPRRQLEVEGSRPSVAADGYSAGTLDRWLKVREHALPGPAR